ncbi:2-succinyl-6-hydroxy-2,4-cyclohexadiene-1-carboxylate synthase [Mesobacillus foraminis]|uniref:2-succinyl-6-hydroxy-2, 4-cyclohexadiene-1-carboxylate synthase n=1 Tax=Mesobacillus foraminis TaxID=279826 RepID=UPI00214B60B4|nr:2-succinyl-6-hydroxy-2,4-cyclohexadiene-1-carboxylate synthase [Mesobacillus foraminis]
MMQRMMVKIRGINYHIEISGNGFPLVLLHGFTGAASTWKPLSPVLPTAKLIMVDIIGHGRTDSPLLPERYRIEEAAADLNDLLAELGYEKVDLLGYSMGGRLAITFAALFPDKIRKLVLESTSPGLKNQEERDARTKRDRHLAARILSSGLENFINYWEDIPLFKTQMHLPASVREQIRKQRLQNDPEGLANSLIGMGTGAQPSWWEVLDEFSFETLIITGDLDAKFCEIGSEMKNLIPKAQHVSIANAGHAIHVEEPEKFGTIVSGFLSKND